METCNRFFIYWLFLLIVISCNNHENARRTYFDNGKLKSEIQLKNGIKDGTAKEFYPNGYIKYHGNYKMGLKVGLHREFYETDSGKIHYEAEYDSLHRRERIIIKRIIDEKGLITYESTNTVKNLKLMADSDTIILGDTLKLQISILNPKYEFVYAYIGDLDSNWNIFNPEKLIKIQGDDHHVSINAVGEEQGLDTIKGFISDFTIVPVTDSIGITKAEDTYFEYTYFVKNHK